MTPGGNARPATEPSSFSLKSRRRTASLRLDGSGGAGARREGRRDTEREKGRKRERTSREREEARLNAGREAGAAWEGVWMNRTSTMGPNPRDGESREPRRRRDGMSSDGHSILCVASFRAI